jgi:septum formation protein
MIILASQSEARNRLLATAGVTFTTQSPPIDEIYLKSQIKSLDPAVLAQSLANSKSLSVSATEQNSFVIGADQTLSCGTTLLNKPLTLDAARQQLLQLRGQSHTLTSAVSVSQNNQLLFQHCSTATLTMRRFSDAYLEHYLTLAGPAILHCVGSYQIEGPGIHLFSDIEGDLFTIQGLPLLPLLAFLRETGELPV